MSLLHVSDISKQIGNDFVLQGIHFTQQEFQKIAIAGESGSGKSTLLKIIGGLIQPDTGQVLFDNKRVKGPYEKLIPGHDEIAYLSQQFELRNNYRVEEVLSYANNLSAQEAATLYDVCQISHLLERRTDQVSGGEKQRIALTRLLTTKPRLLLLDEPYSNLDMIHRNTLKSVIDKIGHFLKITCVLVSHDPADILPWADDILVLKQGQVIQQGNPQQVYRRPVNEYVAELFGQYNLVSAAAQKDGPQDGKKIFTRPEDFTIVKDKGHGIETVVNKVTYLGSADEVEVLFGKHPITIRTGAGHYTKGDTVYIALKPGEWWYL